MLYPKLSWDIATAYDLFLSLNIIHQPVVYGLRASWAAGVRSRISPDLRDTLEQANLIMRIPMFRVYNLPAPKNTAVLLEYLEQIPPDELLPRFFFRDGTNPDYHNVLMNTKPNKKWSSTEMKIVREFFRNPFNSSETPDYDKLYCAWAKRKEFGERYLAGLKMYADSFFYEEEKRILPSLRRGLAYAQARAGSLMVTDMLEELSQGVRFKENLQAENLVLAPSFWGAPFIIYDRLDAKTIILLYGARPDDMALVSGDIVPESLLRGLKALADPTRLRILRYLADGPQTPTQLARVLRLRAPTVIHHLMALRMAGLVQVIITEHGERHYSPRLEGFDSTQEILKQFVNGE